MNSRRQDAHALTHAPSRLFIEDLEPLLMVSPPCTSSNLHAQSKQGHSCVYLCISLYRQTVNKSMHWRINSSSSWILISRQALSKNHTIKIYSTPVRNTTVSQVKGRFHNNFGQHSIRNHVKTFHNKYSLSILIFSVLYNWQKYDIFHTVISQQYSDLYRFTRCEAIDEDTSMCVWCTVDIHNNACIGTQS